MADDKPTAVWVHHPLSGRTQRVSAAAWTSGDLVADGWTEATADQVAVVNPPTPFDPEPAADAGPVSPRSRRRQ